MLKNYTQSKIEFISYNHEISLCHGELKFKIEDVEYVFSSKLGNKFWSSGGSCGFNRNYTKSYTNIADWVIDVCLLPDELKPYAADIDSMFNNNVEHGCCGACL